MGGWWVRRGVSAGLPALLVGLLLSMVGAVAAAPPLAADTCASGTTAAPILQASNLNQGLGAYATTPGGSSVGLVRGKEALLKLFLSAPCGTTSTWSIDPTRTTLTVKDHSGVAGQYVGATLASGLGTYSPTTLSPLAAYYTGTPSATNSSDPVFDVPGNALIPCGSSCPSLPGSWTGEFDVTVGYSATDTLGNTTTSSQSYTITATVGALSNALRILVQPMGDATPPNTYASQFSSTAQSATASAMTTLGRLFPVPSGVSASLLSQTGGVRYTINPSLVNLRGVSGAYGSDGKFCGGSGNWTGIKALLDQALASWNSLNPSAPADRVLGVVDGAISDGYGSGTGCADGYAGVLTNEAWVRAVGDQTIGGVRYPSYAGAVAGMEIAHTFGLQPSSLRPSNQSFGNHSLLTTPVPASDPAAGDGFNVTLRQYLTNAKTAMAFSISQTSPYNNDNVLFEQLDEQDLWCAMNGPLTSECTASGTTGNLGQQTSTQGSTGTTNGVGAGFAFVMAGTVDTTQNTASTTRVVESYYANNSPYCIEPNPGETFADPCQPQPSSPYRLIQLAPGTAPGSFTVKKNSGVPVSAPASAHIAGGQNGGYNDTTGLFSIQYAGFTGASKIRFYYCPPTLGAAQSQCEQNPNPTGVDPQPDPSSPGNYLPDPTSGAILLYARDTQGAAPQIRSFSAQNAGLPNDSSDHAGTNGVAITTDGQTIAYDACSDGGADCYSSGSTSNPEIFVKPASSAAGVGATAVPFPNGNSSNAESWPAWDPTGSMLYFVGGNQLWRVSVHRDTTPPTVGTPTLVWTPPAEETQVETPTVSPDGSTIAFGYGGAIWALASDGSGQAVQQTNPTDDPSIADQSPMWSEIPGDTRIFFARFGGTTAGIDTIQYAAQTPASDQAVQFMPHPANGTASEPWAAADGRLYYTFRQSTTAQIHSVAATAATAGSDDVPVVPADAGAPRSPSVGNGNIAYVDDPCVRGCVAVQSSVEVRNLNQRAVSAVVSSPAPQLLTGDLVYTCGNGLSFPVAVAVPASSVDTNAGTATFNYSFDPSLACGGSGGGSLSFWANDGFTRSNQGSSGAVSQPVASAAKPPVASASAPQDGSTYGPTSLIPLNGAGVSAQDGSTPTGQWYVDSSNGALNHVAIGAGASQFDARWPSGQSWPVGTLTFTYVATDSAGRSASTVRHVTIVDNTPPTITLTHTPNGGGGWDKTSPTTVNVNAADPDGGLASVSCTVDGVAASPAPALSSGAYSYAGSLSVSADGTHQVACTATDTGNNTANATSTVKIDSTPPSIAGSKSPAPNANGWNNAPVTVSFTCTDGGSGVGSISASGAATGSSPTSPLAVTASADGANQSVTGTCTDVATNSASTVVGPINIDRTPPTITVTAPASGANYTLGQSVTPSYTCADALSGVATCSGPSTVDTSSVGSHTYSVTATDRAGNATTVTVTYGVTWKFVGFNPPVANPTTVNSGQAGRTYPMKWSFQDASGNYIDNLGDIKSTSYYPVNCSNFLGDPTNLLPTNTSGTAGLTLNGNTYQYNWQTPATTGCYVFRVTLNDGLNTTYNAWFNLV